MEFPAEGEVDLPQDSSVGDKDVKEKKKSRKSRREGRDEDKHSKKRQVSPSPDMRPTVKSDMKPAPAHVKPPVQAQATSSLEVVQQPKTKPILVHTVSSNPEQKEYFLPGSSGEDLPVAQPSSSLFGDSAVTGAYRTPPEPDTLDIDPPLSEASYSDDQAGSDEGEISSDNLERPEQTEDMNYRETVRSIRSFM